jgi:hypothetical protein
MYHSCTIWFKAITILRVCIHHWDLMKSVLAFDWQLWFTAIHDEGDDGIDTL